MYLIFQCDKFDIKLIYFQNIYSTLVHCNLFYLIPYAYPLKDFSAFVRIREEKSSDNPKIRGGYEYFFDTPNLYLLLMSGRLIMPKLILNTIVKT